MMLMINLKMSLVLSIHVNGHEVKDFQSTDKKWMEKQEIHEKWLKF